MSDHHLRTDVGEALWTGLIYLLLCLPIGWLSNYRAVFLR